MWVYNLTVSVMLAFAALSTRLTAEMFAKAVGIT